MLERLHSVKNNSNFEIAALFHHLYSEGKSAPISKLELFLTEWNRSYVVFALTITYMNSFLDIFCSKASYVKHMNTDLISKHIFLYSENIAQKKLYFARNAVDTKLGR